MASFVQDTLRSLVGRIEVRTTAGTFAVDDPFSPEPSPVSSVATRLLQPTFFFYAKDESDPLYATGPAPTNYGPTVTVVGGLLLGWLTWRAFGRR